MGTLVDTTLQVEGSAFPAHRLVLAAGSEYFEKLFGSSMSDANAPPTLADVPAAAFEPLLAFRYEGCCSVDEGVLTPLLKAANFLGVKPLELSIGAAL